MKDLLFKSRKAISESCFNDYNGVFPNEGKINECIRSNEENYLNKFKNSKSKLAKKINLNYLIRRFRKKYLKN